MIPGIGGSDNYRNQWVKSFPEYLGQMIPGRVGQILPVQSNTGIKDLSLFIDIKSFKIEHNEEIWF